jgi:Holliday junction DNA helicase RuvB
MIEADRLVSPDSVINAEEVADRAIRPKLLAEYVGQPQVRSQMEIFIQAAKLRGDALDHLLIFGPQDLGKPPWRISSLMRWASICVPPRVQCWKKRATWRQCSPTLSRMTYCLSMKFTVSPVVEEVLYPAMEDYQLDIMIGEGLAARSIKIDLPPLR